MKRRVFLVFLIIIVFMASLAISHKVNGQTKELEKISKEQQDTVIRIEQERKITQNVNSIIQQKQLEVMNLIKNGDLASIQSSLDDISKELTIVKTDFSTYQNEYKQSKITAEQLEQKLADTRARIEALDAKYLVLQTAVDTLNGSLDDKIKAQLGDIEKLKEDIKQQVIDELNSKQN